MPPRDVLVSAPHKGDFPDSPTLEEYHGGEYPASFPLRLALKDANLVMEAAEQADLDLSVVRSVAELLERAAESGHADEDMAAAFEAACRRMS